MPVTYEPWLVLLSIVMAIQGAYVGLSLAVQIADASGVRRRLLLAGATASLAVAIWTMHFVGMLAVRLPFQVDYLVLPTLLSFLICAIVVGAAVYATSSGPLTLLRLTLAACLMGGGIFTMHYIGMNALDASAYMIHNRFYVAASMAIAVAASGLALWLATGRGGRPPLILSATAFGIAVSGMHYTAMAGETLYPFVTGVSGAPALSSDLLAIVVAVVAFCISGIFLLLLLPDATRAVSRPRAVEAGGAIASAIAEVTATPSTIPAAGRAPAPVPNSDVAPMHRSAAPARRRGALPAICRSSEKAARISSPSMMSSRFMPTRTTLICSTATTNCFVRWPSATSNRGSTEAASCAFTAATSSISTVSSATGGPATTNWSRWRRRITMLCRSAGAESARSNRASPH